MKKKKKSENEIYCVFCGTKNVIEDKKCKKCKKKLNPKNHLLRFYLEDHLKDDIKSNIEDTIFDLIKEWIIKHLFGISITALIGALAVTVAIRENNIRKIEKSRANPTVVSTKFTLKVFCNEKDLVDKIRVCDEGYTLEGTNCVKRTSVAAKSNSKCPNNYSMKDGKCISNNTVDKIETVTCNAIRDYEIGSDGMRYKTFGTVKEGNKCYAKLCHEYAGVAGVTSESDCASIELVESGKTSTYSCSEYTDSSGNCHTVQNISYYYSCDSGTLSGSQCVSTDTKESKEVCPEGSVYDDECGKCERGAK